MRVVASVSNDVAYNLCGAYGGTHVTDMLRVWSSRLCLLWSTCAQQCCLPRDVRSSPSGGNSVAQAEAKAVIVHHSFVSLDLLCWVSSSDRTLALKYQSEEPLPLLFEWSSLSLPLRLDSNPPGLQPKLNTFQCCSLFVVPQICWGASTGQLSRGQKLCWFLFHGPSITRPFKS